MMFKFLIALFVVSIIPAYAVEVFGTCTTPGEETGACINIRQCPSILSLLRSKPLPPETVSYLQKSQCGYNNNSVLVCCPDASSQAKARKLELLPTAKMCGNHLEDRIFRGAQTDPGEFNWNALVQYTKDDKASGFHCGGVLINDRYILTAAHCVTGLPKGLSLTSVRLGEWNTSTTEDCVQIWNDQNDCADPHIDVPIEKIIPHEKYAPTPTNQQNDIALIRLATKVNYTDFIQPICVPMNADPEIDAEERPLFLVGWGVSARRTWSDVKKRGMAQVVTLNKCQVKDLELTSSQLCIENHNSKDATCSLDFGGPVISPQRTGPNVGRLFVVGIQSLSIGDCSSDHSQTLLTRVRDYADWILENIES